LETDTRWRFERTFYERETTSVAREILGGLLVCRSDAGISSGRIVEVEAYADASDLASHAARLKRGGVEAMWGSAGIAYVYRAYGIHTMFNVVAREPSGTGAVLIRAIEPLVGIDLMRSRRAGVATERIGSGPGNVCQALGIALADHGTDLTTSKRIWIEPGNPPATIVAGVRIGISRSIELPWRFFDAGSRHVSAHRRGTILS
jgi:DNA-3-methyladenine glycosylase